MLHCEEEEALDICEDTLGQEEIEASQKLQKGGFAACQDEHQFHIFKIASKIANAGRNIRWRSTPSHVPKTLLSSLMLCLMLDR